MGFVCFCSFVRYLGFCIFGGYLCLKRPHIFGEKKQEKNVYIRKRLGKGTLNTCAKFQGLTLKNGVDIWTFVRLSAKITAWHRNYLVLVYFRFWSLIWPNIGPTQLVLRNLRETLYKHALKHLEAAGPEKKWVIFISFYSKCLSIFDLFEGLWLVGTHFRC